MLYMFKDPGICPDHRFVTKECLKSHTISIHAIPYRQHRCLV